MDPGTTHPHRLLTKEYRTLSYAAGPLVVVQRTTDISYGEIAWVMLPGGARRLAQVLEVDSDRAVVQVFAGTRTGPGAHARHVHGDVARLSVSLTMLGRVLDGSAPD